jgi:hypothetical protein
VDDYRGYDATRRTGCHKSGNSNASTFTEDSTNVPTQHGTAMALAMASLPTRVTSSIAGVAPGVLYLPIAYRGNATLDHAYAYVVAMKKAGVPIRVVNLSLGNSKPLPTQCAARAKNGQSTLVTASAGCSTRQRFRVYGLGFKGLGFRDLEERGKFAEDERLDRVLDGAVGAVPGRLAQLRPGRRGLAARRQPGLPRRHAARLDTRSRGCARRRG